MVDFEGLFNGIILSIRGKDEIGQSITDDLVDGFQKLYTTINTLLTRVGRNLIIQSSASLEQ